VKTHDVSDTKEILNQSFARLESLYLTTSVLSAVRTYAPRNNVDMECWTFFCAMIDFQVPVINWLIPMIKAFMREMELGGNKFIDIMENPETAREILLAYKWGNDRKGFSHRFVKIEDLLNLFKAMNSLLSDYSSLGNFTRILYETKGKPLISKIDRIILDEFLKVYGHLFDLVSTEYPLGLKRVDAVVHMKDCKWCVIEVEEKLNYTAIGQAVAYKRLYEETKNLRPEALIVCRRADLDLKDACEIDAGIKVIVIL
jgi:hypothetical protein